MRRYLLVKSLIALLLVFGVQGLALAQGTGGGIDAKIGFVNSLEILQGCAEGKAKIAEMDAFANARESELRRASEELNTLRTNYQREAPTLNPATAAEMQAAVQEKDKEVRRLTEDAETELENRRAELFSEMGEKIRAVISEYAVANEYDIIFLESPGLPYHDEALNLTDEIIRAYDAKHPVN